MNKWVGSGRLTAAPELSTTNSGVKVCRFNLAVDRPYKDQSGEKVTDFFNIIAWRELGENCNKYLEKGQQCIVVGRVEIRAYEDSKGVKKYITEVIAENVEFGTKAQQSAQNGQARTTARPKVDELVPIDETDDLPF